MLNFPTRSLLVAGALTMSLGLMPLTWADKADESEQFELSLPEDMRAKFVHEPVVQIDPQPDPKPAPAPAPVPDVADAPLIQIAILLDTSNSMDGLIDQAKAQLWMIVNRFAKAQRNGLDPNFQIALFEYGNTGLPAEEGYIRQVVSFTNDLDAVSAALFALKTNGGDEYCGQVINEALSRLPWSQKANDFKAIYIAGNEPFTQGNVDYVGVCERARGKGVLVNTIHCGNEQQGIQGMWQHGAHLSGGSFLTINQDRSLVHEPAPQDERLAQLNTQLNGTYLAYGGEGKANKERQEKLDTANAELAPDAAAERFASKAGRLYSNGHWDLVDACGQKDFDLSKVPDEQLPEAMRGKTLDEKQAHIKQMAEQRAALQKEISKLAAERAEHVAEARAKRAETEGETLGEAVNQLIDEQLKAQGYEVKAKEQDVKEAPAEEKPEKSPETKA